MTHSRPARRLITVAAVLAAFASVAVAGPAQAAKVQVTKAEYKKVKIDMTQKRVTNIVGAKGEVYTTSETPGACVVKRYTAWNSQTVYFRFQDPDGDGVRTIDRKVRVSPIGGTLPPVCPSEI